MNQICSALGIPIDSIRWENALVANAIAKAVKHPIAYIHMPVPRQRATDDFMAPLRDLKLAPGTELYLGVIHAADGVAGARERIALARKYVGEFGIATECGFARARKPDLVNALIDIHAGAAVEPD